MKLLKKILRLVNTEKSDFPYRKILSAGLWFIAIAMVFIVGGILYQIFLPNSFLNTKVFSQVEVSNLIQQTSTILTTSIQSSSTETISPSPIPTKTPIKTPLPTNTESASLFTNSAASYLPTLDMLPRTFYLSQISEFGEQENILDEAFVGFQNDVPLNYHTDGIYLVAYHSFIFENNLQASQFSKSKFSDSGINDYYNWLIGRTEVFSPKLFDSKADKNFEIHIYTARLQGFEMPNIGVFYIIRVDNLVYVMTAVSTETSSASLEHALDESYSLLKTPFDQIISDD